jgi:hypothetical protein
MVRWFSGIKVYHNGDLVAENNVMIARDKYVPYTSVTVVGRNDKMLVEVYAYSGLFTVQLQLKVNGDFAAGQKF